MFISEDGEILSEIMSDKSGIGERDYYESNVHQEYLEYSLNEE